MGSLLDTEKLISITIDAHRGGAPQVPLIKIYKNAIK
jgi:hypothetical protein